MVGITHYKQMEVFFTFYKYWCFSLRAIPAKFTTPGGTAFLRNSDGGRVSIISASKVGGGLANISSEGGYEIEYSYIYLLYRILFNRLSLYSGKTEES